MKTLVLIRHAKSSWKNNQLRDHERPLNNRGEQNLTAMADHLSGLCLDLQEIHCSSAVRAILTADALAPVISSHGQVHSFDALYCFEAESILDHVRALSEDLSRIAIVGHNPALTDLFNHLAPQPLDNLPTCAIALLELNTKHWRDLSPHCATQRRLLTPKQL